MMRIMLYRVKTSDTLWGIARDKLGDPNKYRSIRDWNNLPGFVLKPGQYLILYNTIEEEKGKNGQIGYH